MADPLDPGERVLLVLATATGGVGRHVESLAAGLVASGVAVQVAAPQATLDRFRFPCPVVVEVGTGVRPWADLQAVRRLARLARPGPAGPVVHAHGLRAGALAAIVVPRGRLVVTWHNPPSGTPGPDRLSAGPRTSARAALGGALAGWVARRAGITLVASTDLGVRATAAGAADVRVAPVAAPELPPAGGPGLDTGGRDLVLAVGRLHPQKGYEVLLAARDQFPDAVLAVAGDGPLRDPLRVAAPDVRWLGACAPPRLADLYRQAAVVVLPSHWEARSLTAQEALRAARPLVATAVGGLPELLGDGAVLVPAGDPAALGRAVRALLDDPGAAGELSRRAAAVAAGWPTVTDTVDQARATYADLRAGRYRRRAGRAERP